MTQPMQPNNTNPTNMMNEPMPTQMATSSQMPQSPENMRKHMNQMNKGVQTTNKAVKKPSKNKKK